MKTLKHIITWTVWSLLALYLLLMGVTRLPFCQDLIGKKIAQVIGERLGTHVSVGRVDIGLLNRIIIDDISILDQQNKRMLTISRLSASIDLLPLRDGKIRISSAQLFGAHAKFYQKDSLSKPNFQFVLDSLASKDTTSHTPLDLRVNTFIIRHSSVTFDRQDVAHTSGAFNPQHLNVSDISAQILLKALTDDSLNLQIKRLGFQERSGLTVDHLAFRLNADKQQAKLRNFLLEMPSSRIQIDSLNASYQCDEKGLIASSLVYNGFVDKSFITPSDLRSFHSSLKNLQREILLSTHFNGTYRHIDIPHLEIASKAGDINIAANGFVDGWQDKIPAWRLNLNRLQLSETIIDFLHKNIKVIPEELTRIGSLKLNGQFSGEHNGAMTARGNISTGIGDAVINLRKNGNNQFEGTITTPQFDLNQLTDNSSFGKLIADLKLAGQLRSDGKPDLKVNGQVSRFDYNGYSFSNIDLNGTYSSQGYDGQLQIDDPNIRAALEGKVVMGSKGQQHQLNFTGVIDHIVPQALGLSNQWDNAVFAGNIDADLSATTLKDAVGTLRISNFSMTEEDQPHPYLLDNLLLTSTIEQGQRNLSLVSDFAKAELQGDFELSTLPQSFINMIGSKLPTLPGLPKLSDNVHNNFLVRLQIYKCDWLQRLLNVNFDISQTAILNMRVNDNNRTFNLDGYLPAFDYNGAAYSNGEVHLSSPTDTLLCHVNVTQSSGSSRFDLNLLAKAIDNKLDTRVSWNDGKKEHNMSGELNSITTLYRNLAEKPEAHIRVQPSHIILNDTVWNVEPSDILYSENNLLVDHFNVHHQQQHITIDGRASKNVHDSLTVDLNEVEVSYILDLVNFDAVEFSGKATGKAYIMSLFDEFDAQASLDVNNFKFERGRMGTLHALVFWNKEKEQIDINAQANDGPDVFTDIYGFVSPKHNTIALNIDAHQTYVDFMHNFTHSFLSHITGHADGSLLLAGTLDEMNLTGELAVEGEATVTALNTTYQLHRDTVIFVPDEIELRGLPLSDRYGHRATLSGGIHHKHLTHLTFDLFVNADNLLAYDFKDFGDSNFYGTVFASGDVSIKGRPGEVTIDCNVTPQENTLFVYNASSPDAISDQEFIQWGSGSVGSHQNNRRYLSLTDNDEEDEEVDIPTDIHINFLVNCTPAATMRLLMDANTSDYINLNGEGTIRATFYNKGPFNMFGTYTVDHGTYGVTIQNIIKKNFTFNRGGTIVFGGDPYLAALNLQAQHTVSGVSLSDLNIGNTFAANTIRVNCLMNITGQPESPQVDFDLEMPTVNADEQQMIRSVINGQQEMNQQVLYLLAIGRFYNRGQNNATTQQDQTSLAMQSLLSGTLSAQINALLNTVIKNDNWNFGANISTGNEGWHNAEYEGLISGRMLNNRLLLNGQFGYRDNATRATKSFIGDFDIQYLLFPNGNLAVKVYNMTNDRYFTKSSLNTQGIGLIMKKDFNGLGDLFSSEKKKRKKKN